jgi:hypothetical protein
MLLCTVYLQHKNNKKYTKTMILEIYQHLGMCAKKPTNEYCILYAKFEILLIKPNQ